MPPRIINIGFIDNINPVAWQSHVVQKVGSCEFRKNLIKTGHDKQRY